MKNIQKHEYESPRLQIVKISKKDLITTSATGGFKGEDENFPTPAAQNGYLPLSN
ncbi:MAG: hypothetical protein IJX19_10650 [Clostridia bacterium]|nr:hypothetical protein [Clostridia bacterium]